LATGEPGRRLSASKVVSFGQTNGSSEVTAAVAGVGAGSPVANGSTAGSSVVAPGSVAVGAAAEVAVAARFGDGGGLVMIGVDTAERAMAFPRASDAALPPTVETSAILSNGVIFVCGGDRMPQARNPTTDLWGVVKTQVPDAWH
jgi:hypothetical protein